MVSERHLTRAAGAMGAAVALAVAGLAVAVPAGATQPVPSTPSTDPDVTVPPDSPAGPGLKPPDGGGDR